MSRAARIMCTLFFLFSTSLLVGCDDGQTNPPPCKPKFVYEQVVDKGEALDVTDHEADYNGSSDAQTITLIAQTTQTITVSASETYKEGSTQSSKLNLEVGEEEAIYESVHEISATTSKSVTASIGNQTSFSVHALSWGYGDYGVWVQLAYGHLYSPNCSGHDRGNVYSYTPKRSGWCTWVRGPDLFTDDGLAPCPIILNS